MSTEAARPREVDGILVDAWRLPVTVVACLTAIALSFVGWSSIGLDPFVVDSRAFRDEPWRLLTAHFVHLDAIHLGANLSWTWMFGRLIEPRLGHLRFAAMVVFLALGVSLAAHALDRGGIGLSGVVYGMWAFLTVGARRVPSLRGLLGPTIHGLFIAWFFLCVALSAMGVWSVSNIGHAAGAALGAFAALRVKPDLRFAPTLKGALAGAILALVLVLAATVARRYVNIGAYANPDAWTGQAALERKDWATAETLLARAVAKDPNDVAAWWGLACAQDRQGRPREALESAFSSFEAGQRDPICLDWLAGALLRATSEELEAGRFDDALVPARRAVKITSGLDVEQERDAWWNLACVQARREERREAVDAGSRAYALGHRDAAAVEWLVDALAFVTRDEFDAERFESALSYARRAVEIAPQSSALWENVRIMAERAGNTQWVERAKAELARLPPLPN